MNNVIYSVIGFSFTIELKDSNGELVKPGIKRTCFECTGESPRIGTGMTNKSWFTHYNQPLLDKIKDARRIND
jgi:hypothetical protein